MEGGGGGGTWSEGAAYESSLTDDGEVDLPE